MFSSCSSLSADGLVSVETDAGPSWLPTTRYLLTYRRSSRQDAPRGRSAACRRNQRACAVTSDLEELEHLLGGGQEGGEWKGGEILGGRGDG